MAKIEEFSQTGKSDSHFLLSDFIYETVDLSKKSKDYKGRYRNIASHIERFTANTGIVVCVDDFDDSKAEEFIHYLRTKGRKKNIKKYGTGLMLNSTAKIFNSVRNMINLAARRSYSVDRSIDNVSVEIEDANAIYLTLKECERLNALTSISKEAKAVRDRFLLGCFTGLRYSDYSRITIDNIIDNKIVVKTRKTGAEVMIPVHAVVREILERNKGVFPALRSPQAFNKMLKRVCRKAKIDAEVLYERTHGIEVVRKRVKKYTLVSSHTARRTAATNMYLAKIPVARIMLVTGHKTEQAFFRYIRIEREENAKILSEHPFFAKK
jgi:integrase